MSKPAAFLIWLMAALPALAQITVEVQFEQEQFLPSETLIAKIRISNLSGQTLTFGEREDWLVFAVESRNNYIVEKFGEVPVLGKFDLETSSTGIKRVNLAPYFNLSRPGRYTVTATVRVPQWDREFSSKQAGFNIIKGTKLWEHDFGVPQKRGEPELRRYALVQALYLNQITLYARVTDLAENRVFKVQPIGPMVSFSKPEGQVDQNNRLHVLWQVGARLFSYQVIDPEGEIVSRQLHEYGATRPQLQLDEHGLIQVIGGVRRMSDTDLPPAPEKKEDAPRPAQP